jgi:hypothetical protein
LALSHRRSSIYLPVAIAGVLLLRQALLVSAIILLLLWSAVAVPRKRLRIVFLDEALPLVVADASIVIVACDRHVACLLCGRYIQVVQLGVHFKVVLAEEDM